MEYVVIGLSTIVAGFVIYWIYGKAYSDGFLEGIHVMKAQFIEKYDGWAFMSPEDFYKFTGMTVEEYKALSNPPSSEPVKPSHLKVIKKDDHE